MYKTQVHIFRDNYFNIPVICGFPSCFLSIGTPLKKGPKRFMYYRKRDDDM